MNILFKFFVRDIDYVNYFQILIKYYFWVYKKPALCVTRSSSCLALQFLQVLFCSYYKFMSDLNLLIMLMMTIEFQINDCNRSLVTSFLKLFVSSRIDPNFLFYYYHDNKAKLKNTPFPR